MVQRLVDYSMLRVFYYDVYAPTLKDNMTKLIPKVNKCVFLGYQREVKEYRLRNVNACKFIVNKDVSFNESRSLNKGRKVKATSDKSKIFAPNSVEEEIDIDIIND